MNEILILNAAIPFLFIEWLVMLLALLLIATIEWRVIRRRLPLSWRNVLLANFVSTLAGIPLATLLRAVTAGILYKAGVEREEFFSTLFLYGHGKDGAPYYCWLAVLFLLFFNYWISALIEYLFLRKRFPVEKRRLLWRQVLLMNLGSYLLLGIFYGWLAYSGRW